MKTSISNSLIPKLKAKDKPYDVRDDKLIGFLVRVNISGKMLYMCEYARGKRVTIGKVGVLIAAQARDQALEILATTAKGQDPALPKKPVEKLSFSEFLENEYQPWVIANFKAGLETIKRIKTHFEHGLRS